jgi:flagellar transcriptional activator FlhD
MKGNCKKMRAPSLLEEVKQVNVAYLSLIRALAKKEGVSGLRRLGFSEDVSARFAELTDAQLEKLAGSGQLLCRFQMRMADLLSALGNPAESRLGMLRAAALAAVAA